MPKHWRFEMHCPRCGKCTQIVVDRPIPRPALNCGDCMHKDALVVELDVHEPVEVRQ